MLGDSKNKRHSYEVIAELLALDLLYSKISQSSGPRLKQEVMILSQIPLVSRLSQP